jgi:hypothetical protein
MTKRYFIRKSHGDLVQEQNKLLETLLAKQDGRNEPIYVQAPAQPSNKDYVVDLKPKAEAPDIDFYFELDEMPSYIPTNTKRSNVTLQTVETSKASFDEKSVEKLKKTRFNAKLD